MFDGVLGPKRFGTTDLYPGYINLDWCSYLKVRSFRAVWKRHRSAVETWCRFTHDHVEWWGRWCTPVAFICDPAPNINGSFLLFACVPLEHLLKSSGDQRSWAGQFLHPSCTNLGVARNSLSFISRH